MTSEKWSKGIIFGWFSLASGIICFAWANVFLIPGHGDFGSGMFLAVISIFLCIVSAVLLSSWGDKKPQKKWPPLVLLGSLVLISGIIYFFLAAVDWIPGAGDFGIALSLLTYSGLLLVIGIVTISIGIWWQSKYEDPVMKPLQILLVILVAVIILGGIWFRVLLDLGEYF